MITVVNDDILNAPYGSIIIQQVNCQNVMGAGLAKVIYTRYPGVKRMYHHYCEQYKGKGLLGRWHTVKYEKYTFVNMFTQETYGRTGLHTNYDVMCNTLCDIFNKAPKDRPIAMPYGIGCGLAGGDWDSVVYPMLEKVTEYYPEHSIVLYKK